MNTADQAELVRGAPANFFERSCLVVTHPDDEVLWFSSIISRVDRVILCFLTNAEFPDRGPARKRVIDQYPLKSITCLDLHVPLTRQQSDWSMPTETEFGLLLPLAARGPYEHSFRTLRARLGKELAGFRNVFTHNPWGEYGHEMHVQVHRVVQLLADELNYRAWFSNYVSSRSYPLAERYLVGPYEQPVCLTTEVELAHRVRDLYIAEGCWTYANSYIWFENEWFNTLPTPREQTSNSTRSIFSLNRI